MRIIIFLFALIVPDVFAQTQPTSFDAAKRIVKAVYHDRLETFYCGCRYTWNERGTGGVVDTQSCGINSPGWRNRENRIEHEHIVPASRIGQGRACWSEGGREHCARTDPDFQKAYSDPHNLTPSVGSINAARSNFMLGELPSSHPYEFGACDFKYTRGLAQPRPEIRGQIARVKFYMAARYEVHLPIEQQTLLLRWNEEYPVSEWELEKNNRIRQATGYNNPFVTGQAQWSIQNTTTRRAMNAEPSTAQPVIGNRASNIYHLPHCPHYSRVGQNNRVLFNTESDAVAAGFRKAGNCR